MKRFLFTLAALLCAAAPVSAQYTHVQASTAYVVATGNPLTAVVTLPGAVTAGNALLCTIGVTGTAGRNFTVDGAIQDAVNWTKIVDFGGGRGPELWVTANHPGGSETITITHGDSTGDFAAACREFSGFGTSIVVVDSDTFTDPAATDNHFSADVAGVSGTGPLLGFSSGLLIGTATSTAAGTGWTKSPNIASTGRVDQYQVFAMGVSGERGEWTSAGTDRVSEGVIVLLSGDGGEEPGAPRCCGFFLRGFIP
jgi:hypothetical protein